VARLTALGFAWDPSNRGNTSDAGWEAQLARLAAYKATHGHCNVPTSWKEDPRLTNWVQVRKSPSAQKLGQLQPFVAVFP
jgi:hypothetical protein